jgi:hypothetical protein
MYLDSYSLDSSFTSECNAQALKTRTTTACGAVLSLRRAYFARNPYETLSLGIRAPVNQQYHFPRGYAVRCLGDAEL